MTSSTRPFAQDIAEAQHPATTGERLLRLLANESPSAVYTPMRDACLAHPNFPLEELREWMSHGELTPWANVSAGLALLVAPRDGIVEGALDAARYLVDSDEPLDARELSRRLCERQRQARLAPCERKAQPNLVKERDPTGRATALLLAVLQLPQ